MAIAVRSASTGTASSGAVSVTKPSGTASGDLLIAVHYEDVFGSVAAMTGATGFTQTGSTHTGVAECHGKVWQRVADGSEGATFSFGNDDTSTVIVIAITGADTGTPIDINPTWATGISAQTTHTASSISPTGSASLLLCGAASTSDATTSYTPPSGMTEQGDAWAQFTVGTVASLVLSASGATGTKDFVISSSANNENLTLSMAISAATAATVLPTRALVVPQLAAIQAGAW